MVVCSFYMQGRCRYGEKCWNEHPREGGGGGGARQHSRGGSVNRVWINPSQRSGGNFVQPSSFSRDGGNDWNQGNDWNRNESGSRRDYRSSNFTSQNRFASLSTSETSYGTTGGGNGDEINRRLETIEKDMEIWESSGQWVHSCYYEHYARISGFEDLSPEELRVEYYTSRATGNLQSYVNSVQQVVSRWKARVQELRRMNSSTRAAIIAELNNPTTQTQSSSGSFSSTATGFGSSAPSGFGSSAPSGFGSSGPSGFGSSAPSGFGSSAPSGFGTSAPSGFGTTASSGIGSSSGFGAPAPSSGFPGQGFGSSSQSAVGFSFASGSSASQPGSSQFTSSAPTASSFSFASPAVGSAAPSSSAGFSFSSGAAGSKFGGSASTSSTGSSGFGAAAGVSGVRGEENLFTPQSELTPDELSEFSAKRFTLGQIPLRPPPAELLSV